MYSTLTFHPTVHSFQHTVFKVDLHMPVQHDVHFLIGAPEFVLLIYSKKLFVRVAAMATCYLKPHLSLEYYLESPENGTHTARETRLK